MAEFERELIRARTDDGRKRAKARGVRFGRPLAAKQLGLLYELVPRATRFALLINPNNPSAGESITNLRAAASTIGAQIEILSVGSNRDIDTVFATLVQKQADAAPGWPWSGR